MLDLYHIKLNEETDHYREEKIRNDILEEGYKQTEIILSSSVFYHY